MAITEARHGSLTIQQINHIQKQLLVDLRNDTFWDKFCSHTALEDGASTVEWRKLNVPQLTANDIVNLSEGITPAALKMEYVKFTASCVDYGKHIGYTDKSAKYNYDDVVRDAKTLLGQHAKEQAEFRKANAYISGNCTMSLSASNVTNGFLKDLLKARTILMKNGIKPLSNGKYGCIMSSEQAADVLVTYAASITHTSQKEALINGYLGELGGFILYETTHPAIYKQTTASSVTTYKSYCLFIGKSAFGLPVQTISFGDASVQVINHGLGEGVSVDSSGNVVADALNQHGTVGYKVMGFATRILADEAVIRAEYTLGTSTDNYAEVKIDVTDSNRTGYSAINAASGGSAVDWTTGD